MASLSLQRIDSTPPNLHAGDCGLVLRADGSHALFALGADDVPLEQDRLETLACLSIPLQVPEVMDMLRLMLRHPELASGELFRKG